MSYLVLPSGCKVGDKLPFYQVTAPSHFGNNESGVAFPLGSLPSGLTVFNIEL